MSNGSVEQRRQCGAALLLALLVPILTLVAGYSWLSVLLGAAAALGLSLGLQSSGLRQTLCRFESKLSWTVYPMALWALAAAARLAGSGPRLFPQSGGAPWIGLGVLALATAASARGSKAVLRCAALLLVPLAAVLGATLLFALPQLRLRWMEPAPVLWQIPASAGVLLVCGLGGLLPGAGEGKRLLGLQSLAGLLAAAAAAVCAGCLSPALAAEPLSLLTLARSLSLFGVMIRLEVLVSGALTVCTFIACALLLCLARAAVPGLQGWLPGLVCAALLYPAQQIPTPLLLLGGAIFSGVALLFPNILNPVSRRQKPLKKFWIFGK